MKWRILFGGILLFCLGVAFGIEYVPSYLKLAFSVAVFLLCAYLIAKYAPKNFFIYGSLAGLAMNLSVVCKILMTHSTPGDLWPLMLIIWTLVPGVLSFITSKIVRNNKLALN